MAQVAVQMSDHWLPRTLYTLPLVLGNHEAVASDHIDHLVGILVFSCDIRETSPFKHHLSGDPRNLSGDISGDSIYL